MKDLKYGYIKRELQFNFEAKTSRGSLSSHNSYLIWVMHPSNLIDCGWGEAAPLAGLSIDATDDFEELLNAVLELLNEGHLMHDLDMKQAPSIQFAIETAQLDLWSGAKQILFECDFVNGNPIPINGLVWMGEINDMLNQAYEKAQNGFDCIKFKIGAHSFDEECNMLEKFRSRFSSNQVQFRLDANGAFAGDDALLKLKDLNRFGIHSLEQPIAPKQIGLMEEICAKSPIDIALDEELIGLDPEADGLTVLKTIKPAYLILKPTLLGGFRMSSKWVKNASDLNMGWWATSALESNIGLNAIAQWTSVQKNKLPQGLGTGSLYANNIASPLVAEKGFLSYQTDKNWILPNQF